MSQLFDNVRKAMRLMFKTEQLIMTNSGFFPLKSDEGKVMAWKFMHHSYETQVQHGSDANKERPDVDFPIMWYGSVVPKNAVVGDCLVMRTPKGENHRFVFWDDDGNQMTVTVTFNTDQNCLRR